MINNILFNFFKNTLIKNKKFKGIHEGKSCYIFGNGSSLKYFDLNNFRDKISIGTGLLLSHKDCHKLNLKYYYTGHTFFYYKYWTNPYSKKIEKNILGNIYKKNILNNPQIDFFVSLTNYFAFNRKNLNYVHHFNKKFSLENMYNLHEKFSFIDGALSSMIGIAIYLGFKKIFLVGCDYTIIPTIQRHFYEYGKVKLKKHKRPYADIFLNAAQNICDIKTVTLNKEYNGEILSSISYKELTNHEIIYNENNNLVNQKVLNDLNKTNMNYKIFD
jgi:hypothetical protein